jgi:hypothetical protein
MANVKVKTEYPKPADPSLDPVFEEGFAYELEVYLNEQLSHSEGDIQVTYLPGEIDGRFEVATSENDDSGNGALSKQVWEQINAFKKLYEETVELE